MQQQAEEEELGLSCAALAALKEFAVENNLLDLEGSDDADVRLQVQERMDVKERDHDFRFTFGDDGEDEQVSIALTGVNPELGQTLASTGLTVWQAAEEMARFMWEHRRWFVGKRVVELGAGLGLCGVLASKLCTGGKVVITDGGEEFTDSAMDALRQNLEKNSCNVRMRQRSLFVQEKMQAAPVIGGNDGCDGGVPLLCGKPDSADAEVAGDDGVVAPGEASGAEVLLEKLTWGNHEEFLDRHGSSGGGIAVCGDGDREEGSGGGFDFVLAADVIYEEQAVSPLLRTVVDILRLRRAADSRGEPPIATQDSQQRKQQNQLTAEVLRKGGEEEPTSDRETSVVAAAGSGDVEGIAAVDSGVLLPTPAPCASPVGRSPSPRVSTFLLAFARRNVSIERVLREAETLGLRWRVPDGFEPSSASENIYLMCLA